MEEKILKRLEEMAENPEGIISICSIKTCGKVKIIPDSENNFEGLSDEAIIEASKEYWFGKSDFPNPGMYDSIVKSYKQLGIEKSFTQGLSHTFCYDDFKKSIAQLK